MLLVVRTRLPYHDYAIWLPSTIYEEPSFRSSVILREPSESPPRAYESTSTSSILLVAFRHSTGPFCRGVKTLCRVSATPLHPRTTIQWRLVFFFWNKILSILITYLSIYRPQHVLKAPWPRQSNFLLLWMPVKVLGMVQVFTKSNDLFT